MIIDPEFRDLIPPLTADEYKELEASILKEGCREALIVWNDTLIDGHHRHRICSVHNILFNTVERKFESKHDVVEWIIRNQFGRRNLPSYVRTELALKLEDVIKIRAKENQKKAAEVTNQKLGKTLSTKLTKASEQKIDTRHELAKMAGVSEGTIQKVKVIDKMATVEQKEKLRTGELKINAVYEEVKPKTQESKRIVDKKSAKEFSIKKEESFEDDSNFLVARDFVPTQKSIFSLSHYEDIVYGFISEVNPLSYSKMLIIEMDGETRNKYIDASKMALNEVEKIIKNLTEDYKHE